MARTVLRPPHRQIYDGHGYMDNLRKSCPLAGTPLSPRDVNVNIYLLHPGSRRFPHLRSVELGHGGFLHEWLASFFHPCGGLVQRPGEQGCGGGCCGTIDFAAILLLLLFRCFCFCSCSVVAVLQDQPCPHHVVADIRVCVHMLKASSCATLLRIPIRESFHGRGQAGRQAGR